MKISRLSALAFAAFVGVANAGPIGLGGFSGSETVTTFNNLALPFVSPTPLVLGGNTYTTDDSNVRYTDPNSFDANCNNACIANNSDLGWIDVDLGGVANRVGALVGGADVSYNGTVEFYDVADNLLGSVLFGNNPGLVFVGWEDLSAGIGRVRFIDTAANGLILHLDDFRFESVGTVPVPATLPLAALGLMGLVWARRRPGA